MADGTLVFDTKLDTSGAETGLSNFGNTAKSALGGVAKVGAAALAAGATAAAALTKSAVDAYADYEQLTGGIETLFEDLSWDVEENAKKAFQTAGLSANEYMETVMSFSASLNQSLMKSDGNIARSADMADKAITDMADNANKMGSTMESIQNAYQGFAKQNYTMLDNLKLGYGGTKEEMQRLLDDAGKLANTKFDLSSYADIIDAIHVIQENMGITGTTAKEASETISGSFASMKSAWSNMMIAMTSGEDGDFNAYLDSLIGSVETFLGNVIPVVERALEGIGNLIAKLAPVIADKLPALVDQVLPPLLNAAASLINGLVNALPSILQVLLNVLPGVVQSIASVIMDNLPMIISVGAELLLSLAQGLGEALPELIPQIVDIVLDIVDTLLDNIDMLVDAGIQLLLGLADGLIEALPRLIERLPEIIIKVVDALIRNAPKLLEASLQLMIKLGEGLIKAIPEVLKAIPKILSGIWDSLKGAWPKMKEAGLNLIKGLAEGITNAKDWLISKIKSLCNNALGAIKSFFGIASPSKKFKWIGEMCVEGMAEGLEDMDSLADGVTASLGNITANVSGGNVGTATNGGLASAVAEILEGMGVYMDGRAVGQVTASSVNDTLGRFAVRRA